jgi:ketosteroid isomerase-like protein
MSTTASDQLDLAALKRAIEARDAATIAGFYASDATIVMVDHDHPPSRPQRLEGIDAIRAMLDDVYSRDMTHEMTHAVGGSGGAAYTVACRYADGMCVEVATVLEVRDGRIVHEEGVQAWDEAG